ARLRPQTAHVPLPGPRLPADGRAWRAGNEAAGVTAWEQSPRRLFWFPAALDVLRSRPPACGATSGTRIPILLRLLLPVALGFFDELVEGFVHRLIPGAAQPLVADDAFVIEDIEGRPALDVPFSGNGAIGAAAIPERAPANVLLHEDFLELVAIL